MAIRHKAGHDVACVITDAAVAQMLVFFRRL
jgi:hypothetical protein